MVTQLQQKGAAPLGRKLHILRILTTSKSKNKVGILEDAILHIMALQLRIAEVRRQIEMRKRNLQLVKVEKVEGRGYMVIVKCVRRQGTLVAILAVLDRMGLVLKQARVSCNFGFSMEALVSSSSSEHHPQEALDVKMVTHVITNAVEN